MKDEYAVALGLAAFAGGCAVAGIISARYVKKVDDKFIGIAKGINYIQENIDLQIPEEVAKELTRKAAEKVANDAVLKAAEGATKEISNNVNSTVKKIVNDAYSDVKEKVADKLEKEINIQTIEKIEKAVSDKVAQQIMSNYIPVYNCGTSKADVIKACIDSGMDSFDIHRVVSSMK